MITEVNQSNVQEELIVKSAEKTVLFYVYNPADPASGRVTAALENAVGAENEFLTLAKGNVNDPIIQSICMQLQIASLPSICVFSGGRPVDVIGAEALATPESAAAAAAAFMPARERILLAEATRLLGEGSVPAAFAKVSEAYRLAPGDIEVRFGYIEIAVKAMKLAEARAALDSVDPNNKPDKRYADLEAALTLAEKNLSNPAVDVLRGRLAEDPDDLATVEQLAAALSQSGKTGEALDLLLSYLKKDLNLGNLKKVYLDIVATMNGDPDQPKYRRKLYTLMY